MFNKFFHGSCGFVSKEMNILVIVSEGVVSVDVSSPKHVVIVSTCDCVSVPLYISVVSLHFLSGYSHCIC